MMYQPSKKLYQRLQKQYSRRINLDLKRIKKVLSILHNPQDELNNVINVIGSDGKNSFLYHIFASKTSWSWENKLILPVGVFTWISL